MRGCFPKGKLQENIGVVSDFSVGSAGFSEQDVGEAWYSSDGFCQRQFLSAYTYGECCPDRDKAVGLVLPHVNMDMMGLHLAEISSHVSDGSHAVVVLDCAAWHVTGKLVLPSNVSLLPLPPYAPELNPVEQVWQQLRKIKLSNIAYESYGSILDSACEAWNMFVGEEGNVKKICSRNWAKISTI